MTPAPRALRRRGEPAWALLLVLVGWLAIRCLTWTPLAEPTALAVGHRAGTTSRGAANPELSLPTAPLRPPAPTSARQLPEQLPAPASADRGISAPVEVQSEPSPAPVATAAAPAVAVKRVDQPLRVVSAHALLWMAAISDLPMPPGLLSAAPPVPSAGLPARDRRGTALRWSADGWLMVRPDGGGGATGVGLPTYGASQLGAVVRYRLADGGMRPSAYVRATAALEAAAGSARPNAGWRPGCRCGRLQRCRCG